MLCASCGHSGAQLRKVTRSSGRGSSLLVIENIPMWSCPHCGESYFSAQTLHEIERIKALRKSVAVDRSVPVAVFQEVHAQPGAPRDAAR
ncbi:type II toxin-antitoxin system MqsA family antitoxin [Candidatus Accumulibacter vicinus]|uniref:type II toxin-antitoxin system MqsA family antitoxin n=1 Tax=Candidatus Accumulibacter vicinus TaxID=2954382 RepID=UPI00235B6F5D|nr:type II toxin-antitoxin system MqsA family antitoxin [Candidatus Accumulibacter vicinus]